MKEVPKENYKKSDQMLDLNYKGKFSSYKDLPESNIEIAITGRSNSGKSSFLRSISSQKKIIKTSSQPGSTRKIHYYDMNFLSFVDLPGYGYAKISHSHRDYLSEMISNYLQKRKNLKYLFITIDIRRDIEFEEQYLLSEMDQKDTYAILILTKIDKINQKNFHTRKKYFQSLQKIHKIHQIFFVSNLSGKGHHQVIQWISNEMT